MDNFTLITGLASLFGFAVQVFDLFPKYANTRKNVFLILVGVFIGSTIRAVDPTSIKINFSVNGYTAVIAIFVVVIIGFLMAAAFSKDEIKRGEFYGVAAIGFLVFIFVLVFAGATSSTENKVDDKITIVEMNSLAERAIQYKDYNRALYYLKSIKSNLKYDDPRIKIIDERVKQIELLELQ